MRQLIAKLQDNKNKVYLKSVFWGYVILLLVVTLMPTDLIQSQEENWLINFSFKHGDKVIHFTLFFMFTVLLYFTTYCKKKIYLLGIPILFGIGIEIIQYLMGMGRTFDILDIIANSLGVLLAYRLIVNNN